MRKLVILIAIIMAVLHQDFWNWDSADLVLGFMPIGLFYHACFSVCCAVLASLAIKFAWPTELVEWAEKDEQDN